MITNIQIGSEGRYGNQMFQFAALLGISTKTGHEVKIPIENTNDNFSSFFNLEFGKAEPVGMELLKPFDIHSSYFATRAELDKALKYQYQEPHFQFDPAALVIPDNTRIRGCFQSEKYFSHIEQDIRKIFTFRPSIVNHAIVEMSKIKNDAPRVAIHVRRGDYVNNSSNHTLIELSYYQDAIMKFFSAEPYRFVVFSDDPAWCSHMFEGGYIVDTKNPYVDMCMMSMCDHQIIANSSFSWWGAWLNTNPRKKVIAPALWFGPNLRHLNTVDLIPESWFHL